LTAWKLPLPPGSLEMPSRLFRNCAKWGCFAFISMKAQIAVIESGHRHQALRVENTLTDEHGDDVKLKKGAHVEVPVTAETKTVNRHK
jgi:hypothetical protein